MRVIRESVDTLCKENIIYAILKQNPYNFTTNALKAYLSTHSYSLRASMIRKTSISAQNPQERPEEVGQS